MKDTQIQYTFDNYHMRLIQNSDFESYYRYGFEAPDNEVNYFTGTTSVYSKDQIRDYIQRIVPDETRYDFIILLGEEIIGEVVLNDIHDDSAHYRIALFSKAHFSKGIGYWATYSLIDFAFNNLGINSITLEVYPFNKRGIALYQKFGFVSMGTFSDSDSPAPYNEYIKMIKIKDNDLQI